jgi:hypothetical protein
MYDYMLGGKGNFAADRTAVRAILETFPEVATSEAQASCRRRLLSERWSGRLPTADGAMADDKRAPARESLDEPLGPQNVQRVADGAA